MNLRTFYLGLALFVTGMTFVACSAAQQKLEWTLLRDTTGAVCPLVVQATAPGLAPLCVGLSELEVVIEGLTAGVGASDAGLAGASKGPGPDALYEAILAHRTAEAAKASKK